MCLSTCIPYIRVLSPGLSDVFIWFNFLDSYMDAVRYADRFHTLLRTSPLPYCLWRKICSTTVHCCTLPLALLHCTVLTSTRTVEWKPDVGINSSSIRIDANFWHLICTASISVPVSQRELFSWSWWFGEIWLQIDGEVQVWLDCFKEHCWCKFTSKLICKLDQLYISHSKLVCILLFSSEIGVTPHSRRFGHFLQRLRLDTATG